MLTTTYTFKLLAQDLIQAGFSPCNLRTVLGCDEIAELEKAKYFAEAVERAKTQFPRCRLSRLSPETHRVLYCQKFNTNFWHSFSGDPCAGNIFGVFIECTVKSIPVEQYGHTIPPTALEKLEWALALGVSLSNVYVAYPVVGQRSCADPVLYVHHGETALLLAQWD